MPRGRPPFRQLQAIGAMLKTKTAFKRENIKNKILTANLFKNGFIEEDAAGLLSVTTKGQYALVDAGESLAVLIDWDNLSRQRTQQGFDLIPKELDSILQNQALDYGFSTGASKKFVFLTKTSGGRVFTALALIEGFCELNYHVDVSMPTPGAADEKIESIGRILAETAKITTVFLASHDSGFDRLNGIAELLKKKKKKLVRISVNVATARTKQMSDIAVQIRPHENKTRESEFREEIRTYMAGTVSGNSIIDNRLHAFFLHTLPLCREFATENARLSFNTIEKGLNFKCSASLENGYGAWHRRVLLQELIWYGVLQKKEFSAIGERGESYRAKYYVFQNDHPLAKFLCGEHNPTTDGKEREDGRENRIF